MKLLMILMVLFSFSLQAKTIFIEGNQDRPIIEKLSSKQSDKLVILLHAFKTSANFINQYYPVSSLRNKFEFNLVIPSGSKNIKGQRFWNSGEACCDFYNENPDDIAFIDQVIDHYKNQYKIENIYLIGHSNGAFMAQYYLCHGNHKIKGIFSFAGNPDGSLYNCNKNTDTKVILAHGRKDKTVPFYGKKLKSGTHEGIAFSKYIESYKNHLICDSSEVKTSHENFSVFQVGKDTDVSHYLCKNNNKLITWDFTKSGHIPKFNLHYYKSILNSLFN